LGFKVEGEANLGRFSKGLDNVGSKINGLARNITKFGAVAAGAFSAVGFGMMKLAGDAAGPLDALVKSADRAGVSFEALQRLGFAAEQSGSSTQEMGSALEMMSGRLAEAARGSGRAKAVLDAYGISATTATGKVKDANVFFLELADHMQTMSEAESLDLAQKLGLSRGLLTLLRSGRDAIEAQGDIADQAGLVFSEQNARDAEKYNDTLNLFTRSLNALKTAVGVDLLPAMTSVIERMQEWLNANREFIRSSISEVIERLSGHMTTLVRVMSNLDAGPMTALAAAVVLIASRYARFALFVVAIEDLMTHLGGGDSYFGSFIQWIESVTGVSNATADTIGKISAAIIALGLLKPSAICSSRS
jgi:TP901 family phage tail tape measure protein